MSRAAKDRASRLREFHDCDAEFRETGNKEAADRRFRALRKKWVRESDFVAANEQLVGRNGDDYRRRRDLMRKLGMDDMRKEK